MDEFLVIRVMNEATLRVLKKNGENTYKNELIKEYLKDRGFFYKITKKNAFKILAMVGVNPSQLDNMYNKLVNKVVFDRLCSEKQLDINNKNLVIKFY